jgi:NAD+ synthase
MLKTVGSLSTSDATALADNITEWLKEALAQSGADRFVLGLSGGIDSALVCGLCARAAGADRVLGVIMPSASNPDDAESARKVAKAFGIKTITVDLTSLADSFYGSVPTAATMFGEMLNEPVAGGADTLQQLATANVRPRLRMITLYYIANLSRGIVVGTGNKTESMIGYFTKYGDGGVDLLPIADLFKHEVRAVAAAIGVPQSVIDRPPSAGLWQGQTDEGEIGLTYDQLDEALTAIERGDTSTIDPDVLAKVQRMHDTTKHKRSPIPAFRRG